MWGDPDRCVRSNDEHHNPYGLRYPHMVPHNCNIQPDTTNAWWGSELDIIEARSKDNIMSMNIHTGGYKGADGAGLKGQTSVRDLRTRVLDLN